MGYGVSMSEDVLEYLKDARAAVNDAAKALAKTRCPSREKCEVEAFAVCKNGLKNLAAMQAIIANAEVQAEQFACIECEARAKGQKAWVARGAKRRGEAKSRCRGIMPGVE